MSMTVFEVGKTYEARSAYDHECVYTITVTGRTEKTLAYTYSMDNDNRRSKIRHSEDGEYITPDKYSMAPVFRASRLYQPKEKAQPAKRPDNIIQFPQKLIEHDNYPNGEGATIHKGSYVTGNYGAAYPLERGVILQIVQDPAVSRTVGDTTAVVVAIMWLAENDRPTSKITFTTPENIHRKGWRSTNGSPIGVFLEE